jgi:hypothetical protein
MTQDDNSWAENDGSWAFDDSSCPGTRLVSPPRTPGAPHASSAPADDRLRGALRSVDLAGNERLVRADSEGMLIHDVAPDGRWLVSQYQTRFEVWGRAFGMEQERNLSWLDYSIGPARPGISVTLFRLSVGS